MKLKKYFSKLYDQILPFLSLGIALLSWYAVVYVFFRGNECFPDFLDFSDCSSEQWLNKSLAIYTIVGGGGFATIPYFWKKLADKINESAATTAAAVARVTTTVGLEEQIFVDAALEDVGWANQILSSLKKFNFVRQEDEHSKIFKEYYLRCKAVVIFCNEVPNSRAWVLTRLRESERIKIRRGQPLKIAVYTNRDNCVPPQITILKDVSSLEGWLKSLQQNQST